MDTQKPQDCPTPERLRGLLSGELAAGDQNMVTQHIETCPACQHTVEVWLSSPSIEGLSAASRDPATREAALRDLMDQIKKKSVGEMTQAEADTEDRDDSLAFLTPSTKPSHLGRLGQYEVLGILGKGGFGTVFKAFDEKLHRMVAIKVLAPELAVSGTARKRFIREAQAAAAVKSDHIVAIHNVADEANPPYLVMELIDGISLEDRLKNEGALELKEILRIGMQMAEGLAAAHKQGLIHRDIKPGNILLENGVQRVKITDFGLARAADDASVTQSGVIAGTPMFMSPEQAEGLPLDHRSDLFSLGSVLYVMSTGRAPFRASTTMAVLKRVCDETPTPIREINPDVPDWLSDIIAKLHAKQASDRYQTAREVADLLGEKLAELQFTGRAGGVSPLIPKAAEHAAPNQGANAPRSPKRAIFALVIASLVGIAAFLAVVYWPRGGDVQEKKDPIVVNKPPVVPVVKPDDGWVQLFNGKDLTGWYPTPKENWKIEDGVIVGKGKSYLVSKASFRDFHCRMEFKTNQNGNAGVGIRQTETSGALADLGAFVGSLKWFSRPQTQTVVNQREKLVPPDTWFLLEVIAVGKRVVVKVNGRITAEANLKDLADADKISINAWTVHTVLHFRKIEIKELPPTPPAPKDEWVSLFNGKDLTGWKMDPVDKAVWKVDKDLLSCAGPRSYLFSERGEYKNFHLRVEARTDANGNGGVFIRAPFQVHKDREGRYFVPGYLATINFGQTDSVRTGSLILQWPTVVPAKDIFAKPDEWFTLEVIARDNHVRILVNGKETVDFKDGANLFSSGCIALYNFDLNRTIHFRKIEIKELPPTPPAETQPFVVLAKANRAETRHPTLAAAVAAAQSGDTIEIQGNGPFVMAPLSLGKNALTIRAGKGYLPHLKHQPTDPKSNDPLLRTEGPLVLEGLILEREANPEAKVWTHLSTVVRAKDAPFRMANCRVIGRRVFMGLLLGENPEAIVTNCEILGFDDCHGHVAIWPSGSSRTVLENNLVVGTWHGLGLHLTAKAFDNLDGASVRLSRNSIWANFALGLHSTVPADSPRLANPGKSRLRLEADSNIFIGKSAFLLGVGSPTGALADAPTWLTKKLALEDSGNLYSLEWDTLLNFGRQGEKGVKTIANLKEWHKLWGIAKSESKMGTPAFAGGDVLARTLANSSGIAVDNFRLAKGSPGQGVLPGGKDVGADVDLVGPGAAYERWKKTPEYQEWRKKTEELVANVDTKPAAKEPPAKKIELPAAKKLTPEQDDEVKTLVSRGNIAGRQNMLQESVRLAAEALAIDPRSVPAYILRSTAYDALGRYDKAIEDATIGLAIDAENVQLLVNRTNAYIQTAQYEKALSDATRMLELNPTYKNAPRVRANRGVAYAAMGDYKKALLDFDLAVKDLPVAMLYWHRSFVHMRLGNISAAEADRKQAIQLDPTYVNQTPPDWWSIGKK